MTQAQQAEAAAIAAGLQFSFAPDQVFWRAKGNRTEACGLLECEGKQIDWGKWAADLAKELN